MAQYYTDFSEYAVSSMPSDWTARWDTTGSQFIVQNNAAATGGKALHTNTSGYNWYALSWDVVGTPANVEVVIRWRYTGTVSNGLPAHAVVRGGGTGSSESGYYAGVYDFFGTKQHLSRRPGPTILAQTNTPTSANTWYWTRLRANGTTISHRTWADTYTEPTTWVHNVTDSTHSSGWAGVAHDGTTTLQFDIVGVGTDGDEAPKVPVSNDATLNASETDTVSVTESTSVSISNQLNKTDNQLLASSENTGTARVSAIVDTHTVNSAESSTVQKAFIVTDATTLISNEISTVNKTFSVSDTPTLISNEISTVQKASLVTDTSTLISNEISTVNKTFLVTDTQNIITTEYVGNISATQAVIDTHTVVGVDIQTQSNQVNIADTQTVSLIETPLGTGTLTNADASTLISVDTITHARESLATDAHLVSDIASSVINKLFILSDSSIILSTDNSVVSKTFFTTDTQKITPTEITTNTVNTSAIDISGLQETEVLSGRTQKIDDQTLLTDNEIVAVEYTVSPPATDGNILASIDTVSVLHAASSLVDTQTLQISEEAPLYFSSALSDVTSLSITEQQQPVMYLSVVDTHNIQTTENKTQQNIFFAQDEQTCTSTESMQEQSVFVDGTEVNNLADSETIFTSIKQNLFEDALLVTSVESNVASVYTQNDSQTITDTASVSTERNTILEDEQSLSDDIFILDRIFNTYDTGLLVITDTAGLSSENQKTSTDTVAVVIIENTDIALEGGLQGTDASTLEGFEQAGISASNLANDLLALYAVDTVQHTHTIFSADTVSILQTEQASFFADIQQNEAISVAGEDSSDQTSTQEILDIAGLLSSETYSIGTYNAVLDGNDLLVIEYTQSETFVPYTVGDNADVTITEAAEITIKNNSVAGQDTEHIVSDTEDTYITVVLFTGDNGTVTSQEQTFELSVGFLREDIHGIAIFEEINQSNTISTDEMAFVSAVESANYLYGLTSFDECILTAIEVSEHTQRLFTPLIIWYLTRYNTGITGWQRIGRN